MFDFFLSADQPKLVGYALMIAARNDKIIGKVVRLLENIWIPGITNINKRKEAKDRVVDKLNYLASLKPSAERRVLLYPEGELSNCSFLLPFKTGAFEALQPVALQVFEMQDSYLMPTFNACSALFSAISMFIQPWYLVRTSFLPDFIPNDYLFETHADKGKTKAHIYAWAIRDIMSRYSGMQKHDFTERKIKWTYTEAFGQRIVHGINLF